MVMTEGGRWGDAGLCRTDLQLCLPLLQNGLRSELILDPLRLHLYLNHLFS